MDIIVLCRTHCLKTHQGFKGWRRLVCWLPVGCGLSWRQRDVLMGLITDHSSEFVLRWSSARPVNYLIMADQIFFFEITLILVAGLFYF